MCGKDWFSSRSAKRRRSRILLPASMRAWARIARCTTTQFHHRASYDVACNWKVYVDNYLEGYHVPHIHPGLNSLLDYRSYITETAEWYSFQFSPLESGDDLYGSGEALYYFLYPNAMLNILPGRLQTNRVLPLGVDRCRVEFDFYYAPDDSPEAQARRAKDVAFSDEVQDEDVTICEDVQRGLASGSYEAGPLESATRERRASLSRNRAPRLSRIARQRMSTGPRVLGQWMLIALVIGNIIGSGVFVLPAALAPYGAASLPGWGLSLGGALMLALIYAWLAQIVPNHGGAYAYARRAFGDIVGFVVGWSYWVCVWSANAAIAVAFAGSLGSVWPRGYVYADAWRLVCASSVVVLHSNQLGRSTRSGSNSHRDHAAQTRTLGCIWSSRLRLGAPECI